MFNQVILLGRLTRDPELRTTPNGKKVVNANLVTSKKFKNESGESKEQVEFHNLVVWNGAEAFATYTAKGSKLHIVGELRTRQWEKDGQKHNSTEIFVGQFTLLDSKKAEAPKGDGIGTPTNEAIDEFTGQDEEIAVENIPF